MPPITQRPPARSSDLDAITKVYNEAPGAPAVNFLLRLGRALHVYGYPAPSLEASLSRLAERFGLESQFFSTPTSLFSSFGRLENQRTFLQRVEPGEVHLERMSDLYGLIGAVESGTITLAEATHRIDALMMRPPRYGGFLRIVAAALASGSTSLLLGGSLAELVAATTIGIALGLLALLARKADGLRAMFEPAAAALAAFLAAASAQVMGGGSIYIATVAGIILLLPGFTLTVALTELATRHLASGTARLAGAGVTFLTLGFGVALGSGLARALFGPAQASAPIAAPPVAELVALVLAPLAFVVLLRAAPRDAPWIAFVGALAVVSGRMSSDLLGTDLGAFVGALVVTASSRLIDRFTSRPAAIMLVPGILMLVPGSIGFRSVAQLLDRDVVLGVETLFRMAFVAVSLVAGILVANAITPRRREALL